MCWSPECETLDETFIGLLRFKSLFFSCLMAAMSILGRGDAGLLPGKFNLEVSKRCRISSFPGKIEFLCCCLGETAEYRRIRGELLMKLKAGAFLAPWILIREGLDS
jgi:hypothetical protein